MIGASMPHITVAMFIIGAAVVLMSLLACVFGGGGLLMVGGRHIARSSKATYRRSVATILLAGLAWGVIEALAAVVSIAGGPAALVGALAIGAVVCLLATWLIIDVMFSVSYFQAILAWLPTLVIPVVATPLIGVVVAVFVPPLQTARTNANEMICMGQLKWIGTSCSLYKTDKTANKAWPSNLHELIQAGYITSPKMLLCPCLASTARKVGRTCDYFYLQPDPNADANTVVACDYANNHPDGSRNVLYFDGRVKNLSDAEFKAALKDPVNARFAWALWKADPADEPAPPVRH